MSDKNMNSSVSCGSGCGSCESSLQRLGVDVSKWDYVVALAGNPNTGKSTVFNALTGLNQHTGNWPGKTVTRAEGGFGFQDGRYKLMDLPGTYSLLSMSEDEAVARDFILFGKPDCVLVVVDATCLERNLNLALQIMEMTDRVVVVLNLVDEARRKGIKIDAVKLSQELGVPVVETVAKTGKGLNTLLQKVHEVVHGLYEGRCVKVSVEGVLLKAEKELLSLLHKCYPDEQRWLLWRLLDGDPQVRQAVIEGFNGTVPDSNSSAVLIDSIDYFRREGDVNFHEEIVDSIYKQAEIISDKVMVSKGYRNSEFDRRMDQILTSPWTGLPIMGFGLALAFWLTIIGANYPSAMLADFLFMIESKGAALFNSFGLPWWVTGFIWHGIYRGLAWVVAVMLPPMAIFFPMFTILEDLGYLPRVAFNMDWLFKRCGAHGKQALTMTMGFGCNAAGIVATRIIDSPRERLIAILTNNFVPCNGRFPTLIMLATIFVGASFSPAISSFAAAGAVVGIVVLGIIFTLIISWVLSKTVLKGEASVFILELPPYRRPSFLRVIYTSLIDRTAFVLWRAMVMAAPAGALIWIFSNVMVGGESLVTIFSGWLDPFGIALGLDGVIILAYILAIPANEIIVPTILMAYAGADRMFELDSMADLQNLLIGQEGWTLLTAVCLMLFSLLHNPCSTTIFTIWKETRSLKWTVIGALMPLVIGIVVCFTVATIVRLF